jgi:hypothetical protein
VCVSKCGKSGEEHQQQREVWEEDIRNPLAAVIQRAIEKSEKQQQDGRRMGVMSSSRRATGRREMGSTSSKHRRSSKEGFRRRKRVNAPKADQRSSKTPSARISLLSRAAQCRQRKGAEVEGEQQ